MKSMSMPLETDVGVATTMTTTMESITIQLAIRMIASVSYAILMQSIVMYAVGFKEELKHKRLDFVELARTGPLLFLGPKNPLYDVGYVTNGELRALKYVQAKGDQDFFSMNLFPKSEDYQYHKYHGQVLLTNSRDLVLQILKESELCCISCGLAMDLKGYSEIRGIPIRGSEGTVSFGYIKRNRDGLTEEAKRFLAFVKDTINE